MLALEVEFLLGRYTSADYRDREKAEWPPHPSRLYSALVAAAFESGLGESARAALLWLESLPPPHLCADPAPGEQLPVTVYVPVNDPAHDYLPQRAERQPRTFPSVVPAAPTVFFIWPDAEPDALLTNLLAAIAANVTYLGNSRSPVRVRLSDRPPPPNWFPDNSGHSVLRVPSKGRLESLQRHFQDGLRPSAGAFHRYRCGGSRGETMAPASVFGEMVVYRLDGPVPMEIETTLKLTDVLRSAAMRHAQDAGGSVPEVFSGHDGQGKPLVKPHAAFVALPFVSDTQRHADGRVMGVAVVLPRTIRPEERRQAARALARVDHLQVPGVGRLGLERLTAERVVPHNLRTGTWSGPRRKWASVTPVLLDRFPKRGKGVETVVARACEHIGLPRPVEVVADRYSPLHGVEPSFRFLVRRREGTGSSPQPRLFTHVTLTFGQEVRGPVLLGAGRYFGLGLLRPMREDLS
jgi:CRISPR-associated protein Csb2